MAWLFLTRWIMPPAIGGERLDRALRALGLEKRGKRERDPSVRRRLIRALLDIEVRQRYYDI